MKFIGRLKMRVTKNNQITFIQGGERVADDGSPNMNTTGTTSTTEDKIAKIKEKIAELFNVKNVNFLLGAGTSAGAIPTMNEMEEKIENELNDEDKTLYGKIKDGNLENKLEILYATKNSFEGIPYLDCENKLGAVDSLINEIEKFIYEKINVDLIKKKGKTEEALSIYKEFYQKITLRNKDLSRINIFTTNSDLLNETALDDLNINYNNGFGGGLKRVFNPARFRYTFSKKIDVNLEKFEPLEDMVYLYKLHGSINWVEKDGNYFFNIHEISVDQNTPNEGNVSLIYPTPLKQKQSLGSPYTDIIREFQTKLSLPNSVLFVIGYSFSDEHINNIVYQSLTSNSSLSVVIFGKYKNPLTTINDNRIYQIYSKDDEEKIHHFDYIVTKLLPKVDENRDANLLDGFRSALKKVTERK